MSSEAERAAFQKLADETVQEEEPVTVTTEAEMRSSKELRRIAVSLASQLADGGNAVFPASCGLERFFREATSAQGQEDRIEAASLAKGREAMARLILGYIEKGVEG